MGQSRNAEAILEWLEIKPRRYQCSHPPLFMFVQQEKDGTWYYAVSIDKKLQEKGHYDQAGRAIKRSNDLAIHLLGLSVPGVM